MSRETKNEAIIRELVAAGITSSPKDLGETIMRRIRTDAVIVQPGFRSSRAIRVATIAFAILVLLLDLILIATPYPDALQIERVSRFIGQLFLAPYSSPAALLSLLSMYLLLVLDRFLARRLQKIQAL